MGQLGISSLTVVGAEEHGEEGNHPPVLEDLGQLLELLLGADGVLDKRDGTVTTDNQV